MNEINSGNINSKQSLSTQSTIPTLRPLYPETDKYEYNDYVSYLEEAVNDVRIRNIALSGPYGVGKSTILGNFKKKHDDAVFISFSTLGLHSTKKTSNLDDEQQNLSISNETNQIQKDIVKQLLYRKVPNGLPESRFRRIQNRKVSSQIYAYALTSVAFTFVVAVLGGFSKLPPVGRVVWWAFFSKFIVVSLLAALVSWGIDYLFRGALHLEKFSVGSTTVALTDKNETYFDQYLDEIIYFFEVSQCRIVIFEDLDRFDNYEIFEELRELNTLLNNAEQLDNSRKLKRPFSKFKKKAPESTTKSKVTFIYAIKDSIFESSIIEYGNPTRILGQEHLSRETERSKRTKFFDLIIPVVPFMTHKNAIYLLREELASAKYGSDSKILVASDLIDLSARYVSDFRLLRNVCNEYHVYKHHLETWANESQSNGDGAKKYTVDDSKLFAMMLYKALHLKDFEDIRFGNSNLDKIYRMSLAVIQDKINEISKKQDGFRVDPKEAHGHTNPDPEWEKQWEKLEIERNRMMGMGMSEMMADSSVKIPSSLGVKEQTFSAYVEETLGSELASILVRFGYIDHNFVHHISLYRGESLSHNALIFRIQHIEKKVTNTQYRLSDHEIEELVSVCPDNLSKPEAYNVAILDYILRCRKDRRNDNDEVPRNRIYKQIVRAICNGSRAEKQFLQDFLSSRSSSEDLKLSLVQTLSPECPLIFDIIIGLGDVRREWKYAYINAALRAVSSIRYSTSLLKQYVEQSYRHIPIFNSGADEADLRLLLSVMKEGNILIDDLSCVDKRVRDGLVEANCYEISLSNLRVLSGDENVSLDVLRERRPGAYRHLLSALDQYFSVIGDRAVNLPALEGTPRVARTISDVAEIDMSSSGTVDVTSSSDRGPFSAFPLLSRLLTLSNRSKPRRGRRVREWRIDLVGYLPWECWPVLMKFDYINITTTNLLRYTYRFGVDRNFVFALKSASMILDRDDMTAEMYVKLVGDIFKASRRSRGDLPVSKCRDLIDSLNNWDMRNPAVRKRIQDAVMASDMGRWSKEQLIAMLKDRSGRVRIIMPDEE